MRDIPEKLFSLIMNLDPCQLSDRLPKHFANGFKLYWACLEGVERRFVLAKVVGAASLSTFRALVHAISNVDDHPVVICSPYLDSRMMKALSSEGIPYIRDEMNVFLPFLGMAAMPVPESRQPGPLSPRTQRIVLNLISGRWDGLSASELSEACGVSASTISGCLAEVEAILPAAVSKEWKRKVLRNPGMTKEGLIEAFEGYFTSPVRRRIYLERPKDLSVLRDLNVVLAGESALSFYSDLAHDVEKVHIAVYRKELSTLKDVLGEGWKETRWIGTSCLVVEEWSYRIDGINVLSRPSTGLDVIDPLGLYVEVACLLGKDDRLDDAIEQLREAACR